MASEVAQGEKLFDLESGKLKITKYRILTKSKAVSILVKVIEDTIEYLVWDESWPIVIPNSMFNMVIGTQVDHNSFEVAKTLSHHLTPTIVVFCQWPRSIEIEQCQEGEAVILTNLLMCLLAVKGQWIVVKT